MDDFNQFDGLRFERTQPGSWRSIPFTDDRPNWRMALKVVGIALLWVALFSLSIWSINQTEPMKNQHVEVRK